MSINSLLNVVIVVPWNKCGDGAGLGEGGERSRTTNILTDQYYERYDTQDG